MLRICKKHGDFGNPKRQRGKNQDPFSLAYAAGYQNCATAKLALRASNDAPGALNSKPARSMSDLLQHERFMRRAIDLAQRHSDRPFASVIVDRRDQQIIAEGWNRAAENPIWHGEIDALNKLAELNFAKVVSALALYSTAEPCPMCMSAILWARLPMVVFGTSIQTLARLGWNQIDIPAQEVLDRNSFHQCKLIGGVLDRQCDQLFSKRD